MKILKTYDKINRNVLEIIPETGNISIKEYNDAGYFHLIINTKLFSSKDKNHAYLSCINVENNIIKESLDITSQYIYYRFLNEKGMLIHSERINLKDAKSILEVDRIYDVDNEFIEVENHRGNKTVKFKLKNDILIKLLNTK